MTYKYPINRDQLVETLESFGFPVSQFESQFGEKIERSVLEFSYTNRLGAVRLLGGYNRYEDRSDGELETLVSQVNVPSGFTLGPWRITHIRSDENYWVIVWEFTPTSLKP